jgi:hypothetical protein
MPVDLATFSVPWQVLLKDATPAGQICSCCFRLFGVPKLSRARKEAGRPLGHEFVMKEELCRVCRFTRAARGGPSHGQA